MPCPLARENSLYIISLAALSAQMLNHFLPSSRPGSAEMISTQPAAHHPNQPVSDLGLVFTDARGRIVFVDNKAMSLLGQVDTGRLVGEPLHTIIRVSFDVVSGLMTEIAQGGYVHDRPL